MPEGAATAQAGHSPWQSRIHSAYKRFRWVGALSIVGLGLLAAAWFGLYPQPEIGIAVPPSPSLVVYISDHVSQVTYAVIDDSTGQPEIQVTVIGERHFANGQVSLPASPQNSSLEVTLPSDQFRNCDSRCFGYAGEWAWLKPLEFDPQTGTATVVFPVTTQGFGVDVKGVYAYAAIPEVSFMSLPSAPSSAAQGAVVLPALTTEYHIPTAGTYDWSSGPLPTVSGPTAKWQEILATSDTPAQTAAGVNHNQQTHDANFNFLAGLVLGLGGSVLLAAIQLLIPSAADPD